MIKLDLLYNALRILIGPCQKSVTSVRRRVDEAVPDLMKLILWLSYPKTRKYTAIRAVTDSAEDGENNNSAQHDNEKRILIPTYPDWARKPV